MLQLIVMLVYSTMIWADLWESVKMVLYIRWLPQISPGCKWNKGIREVVLDETGMSDSSILLRYMFGLLLVFCLGCYFVSLHNVHLVIETFSWVSAAATL
jgi:hypothetical protein